MGTVVGFLAIVVLLQICPILGSIPVFAAERADACLWTNS